MIRQVKSVRRILRRIPPAATAEAAVGVNLALCIAAWAGAAGWVLAPSFLLAAAGYGAVLWRLRRQGQGPWISPAAALFGLGALACALQLIPLPPALLKVVSLPAWEVRDYALAPLGLAGWRPVTLDGPGTWRELAKHVDYLLTLLTVAELCVSRRALRRLFALIAGAGAALAVIGLGHLLLDEHTLFGLFPYRLASPPLVTPFGNPNHLAAFLTLSGTLALGLALTAKTRQAALPWGLGYLGCGLAVLLTLSRGGIVFFGLAQAAMVAAALVYRGRLGAAGTGSLRRPLLAVAAVVVMLSAGAYLAFDEVSTELETANSIQKIQRSKVELWPTMAQVSTRFWPLGMGRGSFEQVFPRFQKLYPNTTFAYPENLVLQLLCELGFVFTLLLCGTALGLGTGRLRSLSSVLEAAALIALLALMSHELFDFATELLPTALGAVILLGALWRRPKGPSEPLPPALWQPGWGKAAAGFGALVAIGLCGVLGAHPTAEQSEQQLASAMADPPRARALGIAAIDRHPCDYRLYSMVAAAQERLHPQEALAFLNRALFLKPLDGPSHRAAARALRRLGRRSQALLEYRLAIDAGTESGATWREALPIAHSEADLHELVGDQLEDAAPVAEELVGLNRAQEAVQLLAWAQGLAPEGELGELWLTKARFELEAGEGEDGLADLQEAERRQAPHGAVLRLRAQLLHSLHRPAEAYQTLERALEAAPDDVETAFVLAELYAFDGLGAKARTVLRDINSLALDRPRWFRVEGDSYKGEGKPELALESYEEAVHLEPQRPDFRYAAAEMLENLHRYDEAMAEVTAARAVEPVQNRTYADNWLKRLGDEQRHENDDQLESLLRENR